MLPVYGDLISPGITGAGGAEAAVQIGLTAAIEFAVVFFLARKVFKVAAAFGSVAAAGIVPSLITLSAVLFLGLGAVGATPAGFFMLEAAIALIEALMIQKILRISFKPAVIISVVANIASLVLGTLISGVL